MQEVTVETFEQEVKQSDIPVLVDFSAQWCGPCRVLKPYLEGLANTADGKYKVVMVDIDKSPELADEYNVAGIPTVLVFKNGATDKDARFVGMASKDKEKLFEAINR